jgi:hypothetical protein
LKLAEDGSNWGFTYGDEYRDSPDMEVNHHVAPPGASLKSAHGVESCPASRRAPSTVPFFQ